jgi:PAS domain S-box-containing protein
MITNPLSNPSYLFPPIIVFVVSMVLTAIVLRRGKATPLRSIFVWLLTSIALSGLFVFFMRASSNIETALSWDRAAFVSAFGVFVLFYHFTRLYTGDIRRRGLQYAAYALLVVTAAFAPSTLLVERMTVESYGYAPVSGPLSVILAVFSLLLAVLGIRQLVRRYRVSSSQVERNRLTYLTIGAAVFMLGALLDAFSPLPPAGMWGALFFGIMATIVVVKYHLLDIRIVARSGLAYLLLSVLVAAPFVGALLALNQTIGFRSERWWLYVLVLFLVAIALRPLYSRAQNWVDRLFHRERYDCLKALERFGRETHSMADLRGLSDAVLKLVSGASHATCAVLLLTSADEGYMAIAASLGLNSHPDGVLLKKNGILLSWFERNRSILSLAELNVSIELQNLSGAEQRIIEALHAELYVPIITSKGDMCGLLILGPKGGQQSYSLEDRGLLSTIVNHIAVNLENARLYAEAKATAEALRESERRFRTMVEGAPSFMMIVDRSVTPKYVSPNCYKFTGYTQGELEGGIALWVHRDEVSRFSEVLKRAFRERLGRSFEYKATKKNGETWYASSSWQLMTDYGGETEALIVQTVDVTERRRAEEALQESEERLRLTFESITDGIAICSLSGEIIKANEAMETMFAGGVSEDLAGRAFLDFVAEIGRQKAADILARTLESGNSRDIEFTLLKKDKTEFPAEMSIAVLRNEAGRPSGYVIVVRDVADRKRMEAERTEMQQRAHLTSRLAMVGEMASGIAHEMNNPLTSVIGFSELLMRKDNPEDIRKNIERIHQGAQRVASIVARLLTFARQHKPEWSYIDINEILQNTLALRAYEMETNNIKLTTLLAPNLPHTMADPGQLQQVFLNIVINAEKEMKLAHGKGQLTVKTEAREGFIRISFEDDGPGIAEENMDKIFHPFFTTREVGNGTGLGLSISHGIVKDHDGRIYVRSRLGRGATFFIELPIRSEKEEQQMRETRDRQKKQKKQARGTILVIDDEAAILDYLRQVLANAGYETETVPDTESARRLLREKDYDLILLDIKMPGRSGIELYEDLKATIPGLQNKVIVITGDISSDDTKSFLSATGVACLAKPFDASRLLGEIENGLARSRTKK